MKKLSLYLILLGLLNAASVATAGDFEKQSLKSQSALVIIDVKSNKIKKVIIIGEAGALTGGLIDDEKVNQYLEGDSDLIKSSGGFLLFTVIEARRKHAASRSYVFERLSPEYIKFLKEKFKITGIPQ